MQEPEVGSVEDVLSSVACSVCAGRPTPGDSMHANEGLVLETTPQSEWLCAYTNAQYTYLCMSIWCVMSTKPSAMLH